MDTKKMGSCLMKLKISNPTSKLDTHPSKIKNIYVNNFETDNETSFSHIANVDSSEENFSTDSLNENLNETYIKKYYRYSEISDSSSIEYNTSSSSLENKIYKNEKSYHMSESDLNSYKLQINTGSLEFNSSSGFGSSYNKLLSESVSCPELYPERFTSNSINYPESSLLSNSSLVDIFNLFSDMSDLEKAQKSYLFKTDIDLFLILLNENKRQIEGINLIASENITSYSVLECLGSCLQNKYSEGYPGKRYYSGNKYIDEVELLCQRRALELYGLDPNIWGVNVQAYSGSPANLAIYTAICGKGGRIMGLDLCDGGHLTHGFATKAKKVSASSLFFESMPYKIDPKSGLIDYDLLEQMASFFRPNLIIAGVTSYPRLLDYVRFRKICDKNKAYLLSDMSHIAGLVAAKLVPSPFEYSDVVSTTTHKTLRGPRGALIFYKKELEASINNAVFPCLQGGPHNNNIAAIATALKEASLPDFVLYQKDVLQNAKNLSEELKKLGYNIVTDGTDTHMLLIDVSVLGLDGSEAEKLLENNNIYVNKNTIPGDKSVLKPSGLRLGTPTITTRGMNDMSIIANFIDKALKKQDIKEDVISFSKLF